MSGAAQGKVEQHLEVGVVGWRDLLKIPHVFCWGVEATPGSAQDLVLCSGVTPSGKGTI